MLFAVVGLSAQNKVQSDNWYAKSSSDSIEAINPRVFNKLISKEIESYYSSSNDVSLRKYFATLNSADGSVYIGGNFKRYIGDDFLKFTASAGLKALAKENFATIYKDGEFSPQLGAEFKVNWFFNGYASHDGTALEDPCYAVLEAAYDDDGCDKQDNVDKQVKILQDRRYYSFIFTHWATIGGYIPFTSKKYLVSPDTLTAAYETKKNYNWKIYAGYTAFVKLKSTKLYFMGSGEIYNDDNFVGTDPVEFQRIIVQDPNHLVIAETNEVYVGQYKESVSQSVKGEVVCFPFNRFVGVSGSVKKTFGDFESTDWKLGTPVSLVDSEGDPTVNFELHWKETRNNHVIGIAIGVIF